jgi:hypothetical protein
MKRTRSLAMLLFAGSFAVGCSSTGGSVATQPNTGGGPGPGTGGSGSGGVSTTGGSMSSGGAVGTGGATGIGGAPSTGGASTTGGAKSTGGAPSSGGSMATGGAAAAGGAAATGGASGSGGASVKPDAAPDNATPQGGASGTGGTSAAGGTSGTGGSTPGSGGATGTGGATATGGKTGTGGASGSNGCQAPAASGPVGTISGALATGIAFMDTDGKLVNAHGGGIIQVCDTFYMHGEYFPPTTGTTDNNFNGFSMYSSKDLATWKNEGIILPQQSSGELGPNRKGERPHIIKCPSTGEFVLYAHAADITYQIDKEVIYATSPTVNGKYSYKGPLKNASGATAAHSDMGAFADETGAYVVTESAHVYTLANDCHSWLSDKQFSAINGSSGGSESPAVFKANGTYYWIGSNKTGWRANNNFYSTASSMTGPWTYQGYVAPVTDPSNDLSDQRTWMTQSTWVLPVVGSKGTVYVYWGDHWYGNQDTSEPGKHNDKATYVFQPIVFSTSTKMLLPTYNTTWKIDIGAGTWSQ